MNNRKEIWKDIVGLEGYYQISNHCKVRKIYPNGTYKFLPYPKRSHTTRLFGKTIGINAHKSMLQVFPDMKYKVPTLKDEEWKDVIGYEGFYQVSNLGRIKSLSYKKTGDERLFANRKNGNGYYQIPLTKNKMDKNLLLHRLVAFAFIPNPDDKPLTNHINGIVTDNRVDNLEWVNSRENISHGKKLNGKKSSKYIGICWYKRLSKWECKVYVDGKTTKIGYFSNEEEAHIAYIEYLSKNGIENKYARNKETILIK